MKWLDDLFVDGFTLSASILAGVATKSWLVGIAVFCGLAAVIVAVRIEAREIREKF